MAFPGTYNFNYYRGDTFSFIIAPKNSTGGAFPLTGYSAEFNIATSRGGAIATYASYASGGATGSYTVTISAANTLITVGQKITGNGIPTNTYVTGVSSTLITMSNQATSQISGTLNFSNQYAGTAIVNEVSNVVTCTIPAAIGRYLIGGTGYVYDVQIVNGSTIYTVLNGTITVTNDITGAI
jgi:hypothetical protein